MQQFKIRQDGFKEIKKQMLKKAIPLMLIALTVGIVIGTVNSKEKTKEINVLPFVIPFCAVVIGFGLYRCVNRQKGLFESYTLTFTNNLITREQLNTQIISIYFNRVWKLIFIKSTTNPPKFLDTRFLLIHNLDSGILLAND